MMWVQIIADDISPLGTVWDGNVLVSEKNVFYFTILQAISAEDEMLYQTFRKRNVEYYFL